MFFSEMFIEEFLGEHLESLAKKSNETDKNALDRDTNDGRKSEGNVCV